MGVNRRNCHNRIGSFRPMEKSLFPLLSTSAGNDQESHNRNPRRARPWWRPSQSRSQALPEGRGRPLPHPKAH